MSLSLKMLGEFAVRDHAGKLLSLPTRKTRALFGYLAMNAGRPQPRERLMSLLWSDRGEKQARHSLSQALVSIRKLGDSAGETLFDSNDERVMLRADAVDSDVTRFRTLLADDPAGAAAIYDGLLLDGLSIPDPAFEQWLAATRSELHDSACNALARAADLATSEGSTTEAIEYARRLLALDPLREDGHQCLMGLLHRSGDRSGALRQYQVCAEVLQRELEVEPDAATKALFEKIRQAAGPEVKTVPSSAMPIAPRLSDKPSLAVLPFNNLSGDPEQQFFADGMAEDIITGLSRFHSIKVISRNSSFSYKGKSPDVREVEQKLRASYVLEGSVRRSSNRIRITSQLIDAGTGSHLWAQRYDRDLDDIFAIQDEITMAIVAAIEPAIGHRERERVRQNRTESIDAWSMYQQGLGHYYHGTSAADLQQALECFEASIKADPGFAAAHAMCAESMVRLLIHSVGKDRRIMLQKALSIARTALRLDPDDATAHIALGWVNIMLGDIEGALIVSKRALELNPFSAMAFDVRGYAYSTLGDNEAALECLYNAERLSQNHPYSGGVLSRQAICLVSLGRYEEAVQVAHRAMQGPNRGIYAAAMGAVALKQLGRDSEAQAMVEGLLKRAPNFSVDRFRVMFSQHHNVETLAKFLLRAGVRK
jgi:TolB-like protein/predicted Zn-dependent protease